MGYAMPPNGPEVRPRHASQPVKWVVPGLVARWAYQAGSARPEARIKFKYLYFFSNVVFLSKKHF
jgi:hypothetical protein